MDKQNFIDFIKDFLSVQSKADSFSHNICNIIDELSKATSEDLQESLSSIFEDTADCLSPIVPDGFTNASQKVNSCFCVNPCNNNCLNNIFFIDTSRYIADDFENITPYSGFDSSNPENARQNTFAWSFADLNDFIYVGTGRNIIYQWLMSTLKYLQIPLEYTPSQINMSAEIWRYKKDGSLPWQKVYEAPVNVETNEPDIIGINSLIKFDSFGIQPALYASAYSLNGIKILKSFNGIDWVEIPTEIDGGIYSNNMIIF